MDIYIVDRDNTGYNLEIFYIKEEAEKRALEWRMSHPTYWKNAKVIHYRKVD